MDSFWEDVILLCVLIVSAWVFFGNFGELAFRFRNSTEDLSIVEESKFIGSWVQNETSDKFVFFADSTYVHSVDEGTWVVFNGTIQLTSLTERWLKRHISIVFHQILNN